MRVTIDFETASTVPGGLLKVGASAYWEHFSTEILCLCWITDNGAGYSWVPGVNDDALDWLRALAENPEVVFEAHGAEFEQSGWHYVMVRKLGMPELPPERWDCTKSRCRYYGLPGGLDRAARVLDLVEQKDMDGSKLTISLSDPMTQVAWMLKRPEGVTQAEWKRQFPKGTFDRSPETIERVVRYCFQDDKVEDALSKRIGPLSPYERKVWVLDQKMNQRGLLIDRAYIHACKAVVAEATKPLLREFVEATGLEPTQTKALVAWCQANGAPQVDSLAKDKLKALGIKGLEEDEEQDDDDDEVPALPAVSSLPDGVRRVLQIRAVLGSASIAKLDRMLLCANNDGRIRYTIEYHGAGPGRWAGRLFQPQNFPRGKIEGGHDPEQLVQAILMAGASPAAATAYIDAVYGDPIAAVASGLRHALVAGDGALFNTGDFAGIEARVVLALAGQHDKCDLMASGFDTYLEIAELIHDQPGGRWALPVESQDYKARQKALKEALIPERQDGKGVQLGCGFGMGWRTYQSRYCPNKPEAFAKRCVEVYRKDWAPLVPRLWGGPLYGNAGLEDAALRAMQTRGRAEAYGIEYIWHAHALECRLPDGQIRWYHGATLSERAMPWEPNGRKHPAWFYMAWKFGQWRRVWAYGGILVENAVQQLARGLLCEAMHRLEANNLPLVLTVHDECMSEVPAARSDHKLYEQIMAEPTRYAQAIKIPIAVEGWAGPRYKK